MTEPLRVELYGTTIAELGRDGRYASLAWAPLGDLPWRRNSLALSASLPMGLEPRIDAVENFFGALLPEGQWRTKLSTETGIPEADVAGLLSIVGRDVAGALVVSAQDRVPVDPVVVDDGELRWMLDSSAGYVVGGGGSTLPGYQRKLALARISGRWWNGHGSVPSTHILKPARVDAAAALHAENYCLTIARWIGLSSFESWIEFIGMEPVLVLERYDRRITPSGSIDRIHQEDAAQMLSLPWRGDAKFERYDSRSTLRSIAENLDVGRSVLSSDEPDVVRLLRYATFNVAIGNTDAHAKNFSVLRPRVGRARLAPLYDVGPLALAYDGRQELGQYIDGVRLQPLVTMDNLIAEAMTWGLSEVVAREAVTETLVSLQEATRVVPADASIRDTVPGYIRQQAQNLAAGRMARIVGAIPPGLRTFIGTPGPGD